MKQLTLPKGVAAKFVKNCRAYHAEPNYEKQREIAFDQLERFRQIDPNIRVWAVLEMFDRAPQWLRR
jgi:hypothetical protein